MVDFAAALRLDREARRYAQKKLDTAFGIFDNVEDQRRALEVAYKDGYRASTKIRLNRVKQK